MRYVRQGRMQIMPDLQEARLCWHRRLSLHLSDLMRSYLSPLLTQRSVPRAIRQVGLRQLRSRCMALFQ